MWLLLFYYVYFERIVLLSSWFSEHVFEWLSAFTTATERTTELSIERFIKRLEMNADTAISRLSLAAS